MCGMDLMAWAEITKIPKRNFIVSNGKRRESKHNKRLQRKV